jgi:hypothetical protein
MSRSNIVWVNFRKGEDPDGHDWLAWKLRVERRAREFTRSVSEDPDVITPLRRPALPDKS